MDHTMNLPHLFESPESCCGCGSCAARCPRGAISMKEDGCGFVYPTVDTSLCIGCGACEKVCGLNRGVGSNSEGPFFAAAGRGDVSSSASGGVFASLAREFITGGGVAYGAAYVSEDGPLAVRHVRAAGPKELEPLLNSKYVQSDAGVCFPDVKADLAAGKRVLFCGTPCQVAGLKAFLGRERENLFTVDLVCHGVPSQEVVRGCVASYGERYGSRVVDFRVRCKRHGWGHSLLLLLLLEDGREIEIPASDSPYYDMFLNLKTLRESCYSCPYAGHFRAGDITIGDFWGVDVNRPDVLADGERFNQKKGVSCLLVNNAHGRELIEGSACLDLYEVEFDDIARGNDQLRHPSVLPADRQLYLDAFAHGGWPEMEKLYLKRERGVKYKAKHIVKRFLPASVLSVIKNAPCK